jgi:hypothetical protein
MTSSLSPLSFIRYLESPEYNIHGPEYLVGTEDTSIFNWPEMKPVFFIPQVLSPPHRHRHSLDCFCR